MNEDDYRAVRLAADDLVEEARDLLSMAAVGDDDIKRTRKVFAKTFARRIELAVAYLRTSLGDVAGVYGCDPSDTQPTAASAPEKAVPDAR